MVRFHRWRCDPERLIRKAAKCLKNPTVVQIGSNDGKTGDPIHRLLMAKPEWVVLLVEPVPWLFERLQNSYFSRPGTLMARVAVADGPPREQSFYYVSSAAKKAVPNLPAFYDQVGSFNEGHIVKYLGEECRPFIVCIPVPTVCFADLLQQYNLPTPGILHIDTEGYDWEILRQVDLTSTGPNIILFEHMLLSAQARSEALARLEPFYRIRDLGSDLLCIKSTDHGVPYQLPCANPSQGLED